jgi:hypothetical protein
MMCITNDDTISNDNKCNMWCKKRKCLKEKENKKEGNDEKVVTIEEKMKNN